MDQNEFLRIARALSVALVDDFRGFLVEGTVRKLVPDDKLHLQIAYQELLNVPGWEYESGTGQNPIIEYLQLKKAIYITKILKEDGSDEYQRTVGYLTDVFSCEVDYKGKKLPAYEALRTIAIGMGYDVDEYTLLPRTKDSVKTPASIATYKGETYVKKRLKKSQPHRNLSECQPVFSNGELVGFIINGKFYNKKSFYRYDTKQQSVETVIENNQSIGKSK